MTGCGFGGLCPALCSWHLGTGCGASMVPVSPSFKVGADGLSFTSSSPHLFLYFSLHNHPCFGIIGKGFSMNILFDMR